MTKEEFIKIYWGQFLLLEKDLLDASEYVSIDKNNYDTFSNQFTKLFLTICSEMDSLAEEYCRIIINKNPEKKIKVNNIIVKINMIITEHTNLRNYKVQTRYPYEKLHFVPFSKFSEDATAGWWQDYNSVKHNRAEKNEAGRYNYQKANLKNVLLAFAALYILCLSLFNEIVNDEKDEELYPQSELFESELG